MKIFRRNHSIDTTKLIYQNNNPNPQAPPTKNNPTQAVVVKAAKQKISPKKITEQMKAYENSLVEMLEPAAKPGIAEATLNAAETITSSDAISLYGKYEEYQYLANSEFYLSLFHRNIAKSAVSQLIAEINTFATTIIDENQNTHAAAIRNIINGGIDPTDETAINNLRLHVQDLFTQAGVNSNDTIYVTLTQVILWNAQEQFSHHQESLPWGEKRDKANSETVLIHGGIDKTIRLIGEDQYTLNEFMENAYEKRFRVIDIFWALERDNKSIAEFTESNFLSLKKSDKNRYVNDLIQYYQKRHNIQTRQEQLSEALAVFHGNPADSTDRGAVYEALYHSHYWDHDNENHHLQRHTELASTLENQNGEIPTHIASNDTLDPMAIKYTRQILTSAGIETINTDKNIIYSQDGKFTMLDGKNGTDVADDDQGFHQAIIQLLAQSKDYALSGIIRYDTATGSITRMSLSDQVDITARNSDPFHPNNISPSLEASQVAAEKKALFNRAQTIAKETGIKLEKISINKAKPNDYRDNPSEGITSQLSLVGKNTDGERFSIDIKGILGKPSGELDGQLKAVFMMANETSLMKLETTAGQKIGAPSAAANLGSQSKGVSGKITIQAPLTNKTQLTTNLSASQSTTTLRNLTAGKIKTSAIQNRSLQAHVTAERPLSDKIQIFIQPGIHYVKSTTTPQDQDLAAKDKMLILKSSVGLRGKSTYKKAKIDWGVDAAAVRGDQVGITNSAFATVFYQQGNTTGQFGLKYSQLLTRALPEGNLDLSAKVTFKNPFNTPGCNLVVTGQDIINWQGQKSNHHYSLGVDWENQNDNYSIGGYVADGKPGIHISVTLK